MDYAEALAQMEAREREWRELERQRERGRAAFEAEMSLMHLQAEMRAREAYHGFLYLAFNPKPDVALGLRMLLGSDEASDQPPPSSPSPSGLN